MKIETIPANAEYMEITREDGTVDRYPTMTVLVGNTPAPGNHDPSHFRVYVEALYDYQTDIVYLAESDFFIPDDAPETSVWSMLKRSKVAEYARHIFMHAREKVEQHQAEWRLHNPANGENDKPIPYSLLPMIPLKDDGTVH